MYTIARLAEAIGESLSIGAGDGDRLRLVRQFLMDAERHGDLETLLFEPPTSTGDIRWDAFLAGLAEYVAQPAGLKPPGWSLAKEKFLSTWWFVMPFRSLHGVAMTQTPPAFANRGVFLRRASLINV